MDIISEKVEFKGALGHPLSARLDQPKDHPRFYAIYAPCFTCTKDFHAAARIATQLARLGIAVLRIDFTGLGDSQGIFSETSFLTNVQDLKCGLQYLKERSMDAQMIIGHSWGGTAALVATHECPEIKTVVTLNSPCQPAHVARNFVQEGEGYPQTCSIQIAGNEYQVGTPFFEALNHYSMEHVLLNLNAALLVLHTPQDTTVNIRNANEIFSAAPHPKSFVSLDGMDHLIKRREDAIYIAGLISHWASRYLEQIA